MGHEQASLSAMAEVIASVRAEANDQKISPLPLLSINFFTNAALQQTFESGTDVDPQYPKH